jgi:hypothetical protein
MKTQITVPVVTQSTFQIKKRGCGWPIAGGTYAFVESGFNGTPIWKFLLDPTVVIDDPEAFGLSAISMVLKSRGCTNAVGQEIYDIFDWIGASAYPNPTDWLLEVQNLGFHQKMNPTHLLYLVPESLYFGIHSRAAFENPTNAYNTRILHPDYPKCPCDIPSHKDYLDGDKLHLGTCPGLYFSSLVKGTKIKEREVVRKMPSFEYSGFSPAGGEGETLPAIFFKLPIGRMAKFLVYTDEKNKTHEKALEILNELETKMQRVTIIQYNESKS